MEEVSLYDFSMDESQEKLSEKSSRQIAAENQPHAENGRFVPKPKPAPEQLSQTQNQTTPHTNPLPASGQGLSAFLREETTVKKTSSDDTLVDVHVGNPLSKITKLLEDIKKQKAFTFDLKGSIGAAGIVLVFTTFGIFGTSKAFCSKGEQSHIGRLVALDIVDGTTQPILVDRALTAWNAILGKEAKPKVAHKRLVLIEQNQTIYHLLGDIPTNTAQLQDTEVVVTGEVDACSQTITLTLPQALQIRNPN